MAVAVVETLVVNADPETVFAWLEDLRFYPRWTDLVSAVTPDDGDPPAWSVELSATLGPIRRSKRLRMVRVVHEPPRAVRFERRETDGRRHSDWSLDASLVPLQGSSELTVELRYGGRVPSPLLGRILADAIRRARARLASLACEGPPEDS